MVKHHVGATKNTDSGRELTNCNKMLIKKKNHKNQKLGVFCRKLGGGGGSHSFRIIIHNLGIIK